MDRITTYCPTCLNGFVVDPNLIGREVQCPSCQAHFRVTQSNPLAAPASSLPAPATKTQPAEDGFQEKFFQWGLGLIFLGLVGLILPTFGLQLRRLQRLGEMQWVVLIVVVVAGCGAVLWSRRHQLKTGAMIAAGALTAMLLFAYLSFWRSAGDVPVAQEAPRNSNQAAPPTAPNSPPVAGGLPTATNSTLIAGHERGEQYSDQAPSGGLLVGLRCSQGKNFGGALQAVQPIYQVGTGYALGQRHGTPGGSESQLLAKPGYAVGAIRARAGLVMNALQLVFYRIQDQRLDPNDRYESSWVGCEGGGPFELDVHGAPITEVFGTWKDDIVSLGIKPGENLSTPMPLVAATPPELAPAADPSIAANTPTEPPPATATPAPAPLPAAPQDPPTPTVSKVRGPMLAGRGSGKPFEDESPPGGLLVGLRCSRGKNWGGALQAVQPIYQVGTGYVMGQRHGEPGGDEVQFIAKPGYAIGAIRARAGLVLNAVQLVFYRIQDQRLDPSDHYETAWVGSDGGSLFDMDGQGAAITGLSGTWHEDIVSLGLKSVENLSSPIPLASQSPPDITREPAPVVAPPSITRPPLRAGGDSGNSFQDVAPEGGLLVGLRCANGKNWGGALQAVQPIYQVGTGYVLGQRHGKAGGSEQQLLAKPGYAVGAIHARAGLVLNAVQLSFYKTNGQRLDPSDHYESPWVGSDGGGSFDLDAKGDPITGIFGSWVEDLVSIGCSPTAGTMNTIPLAKGSPPKLAPANPDVAEYRQWTSSDGKSTIEAKMMGKTRNSVRLERRDGKVITVPLNRLSAPDVSYLQSLP